MIVFKKKLIKNYQEKLEFAKEILFYLKIKTRINNFNIRLGPAKLDEDYEILFTDSKINFKYAVGD